MEEFNAAVIITGLKVDSDGLETGFMLPESISQRAVRFSNWIPAIGGHGFIMQANSGTFRRLYADQPALIVIRRGKKRLLSPHECVEAEPGQAVVLPMGGEWTVVNDAAAIGGYQADAFPFAPELIDAYADQQAPALQKVATFDLDADLEEALLRVGRMLSAGTEPTSVVRHLFGEIVVRLEVRGINLRRQRRSSLNDRVRALVGSDICCEWAALKVARALGVSEATLRRKLAAAGTSLTDITADVRMTRALGLLQTTEMPINQIALEVGYGSASKFAARFRERFGISPREIRVFDMEIERSGTDVDRIGAAAE